MTNLNKKDLITLIDQSFKELHRNIDYHRFLMTSILDEWLDDKKFKRVTESLFPSNESKLKDVLKETIVILEQTRKAFKSKRLELLRKRLVQVLIDDDNCLGGTLAQPPGGDLRSSVSTNAKKVKAQQRAID